MRSRTRFLHLFGGRLVLSVTYNPVIPNSWPASLRIEREVDLGGFVTLRIGHFYACVDWV